MTEKQELLPCPHCGGEGEMRGDDAPENWVHCKYNCQPSGRNKEYLAQMWNTRAPSAELLAAKERIRELEEVLRYLIENYLAKGKKYNEAEIQLIATRTLSKGK